MIIFGYIFTIINYTCFCISRFCKEKKNMLLLDILAKSATITGLYCLGSLTGSYNMIVSLVVLITANIKERKQEGLSKAYTILLYLLFETAYITVMLLTFKGISSLLITFTSSVTLFNIWWLSPQKMRLIGGFNGIVFLMYQLSIHNLAGVLELLVIASNFVAYAKYKKKNEKERKSNEYDHKNG